MGPSLTCGHPVRGHWGLRLRQPLSWPAGPRAGLVCPVLGGQAGLCPVASGAAQKDFERRKPAPGTGDSSVTPGGLDAHLSEMKVSLHEGSAPLPRQLGWPPGHPGRGLPGGCWDGPAPMRGSPWRGREDLPSQRRAPVQRPAFTWHMKQCQLRGETSLPLPTLGSCVLHFC